MDGAECAFIAVRKGAPTRNGRSIPRKRITAMCREGRAIHLAVNTGIQTFHTREILDSHGNSTMEAEISMNDGGSGRASVPSGVSTGVHETLGLR
ncbi:MAG: hypothetical protein ACK4E4_04205 [Rhodocyclaceae bacterium]